MIRKSSLLKLFLDNTYQLKIFNLGQVLNIFALMQGNKHKLNVYKSSIGIYHYATAIVSYKTARYFCESFNHEKNTFYLYVNDCM